MSQMEKQSVNEWIGLLEKVDPKGKNSKVAKRILKLASLPKRKRVVVNLSKLNAYAKANENIVVPGKILGTGSVDKEFSVAAVDWSEGSETKLKKAGCKVVELSEMLKKENLKVIM
ncbi:MAG TPA: uL15 family ribosomal protein [Candidatus Saccharimonadales bacterium]|nr:uL15 family ribosomal protein [Candidatus Saccharimonadales bacterium]